jgi:hypothetical protein
VVLPYRGQRHLVGEQPRAPGPANAIRSAAAQLSTWSSCVRRQVIRR